MSSFTINKIQVEKYLIYLDEMHRGGFKVWELEDALMKKFGINRAKAKCVFMRWNGAMRSHDSHAGRVGAVCRQLNDCAGWRDNEVDDDPKGTV